MRPDPPRIDATKFAAPALPPTWEAAPTGPAQVEVALAIIREGTEPEDVIGWVAGLSMFIDHDRYVIRTIVDRRLWHLVPHTFEAFAAGVLAELAMPKKLWLAIEQLALRVPPGPELRPALPLGASSDHPLIRDVATRIAARIGAHETLVAARDTATDDRMRKRLAGAVAALEQRPARSSYEQLLVRATEAWRETFDPALERGIDLLGHEVSYRRGPVPNEDAWIATAFANDPGDHERLIDFPWTSLPLPMLDMLANRDPDPRDVRLLELARAYRGWVDPAIHAAIARIVERSPAATRDVLLARLLAEQPQLAEHYQLVTPTPAAADRALIAELERDTAALERRSTLFEQHAASPGDLALRGVLGDVLVELEDPRGELIALQLAGDKTPRSDTLLHEHRDRWLAPLVDLSAVRFERGFPVAAELWVSDDRLRAVVDRDEWATLERLSIGSHTVDLHPLVRRMPLLEALTIAQAGALDVLAKHGPFPTLRMLGSWEDWMPSDRRAFPNLAVVAGYFLLLEPEPLRARLERAAQLGLEAVVFYGAVGHRLAYGVRQRAFGPPALRFTERHAGEGWRLEVPREGDRADLAGSLGNHEILGAMLPALRDAGIRTLAFHESTELSHELPSERHGVRCELGGKHVTL